MKIVQKRNYDTFFTLLALGIFFAFLIFTINGKEGLLKLFQLKKIRNDLIAHNKKLLLENVALLQEQNSLYHLSTVEHVAKASLGLVAPGEFVYIYQKNPSPESLSDVSDLKP